MEDPRCCGTGTCIINEDGLCWCGQRWDGERMSFPEPTSTQQEEDAADGSPRAKSTQAPDEH